MNTARGLLDTLVELVDRILRDPVAVEFMMRASEWTAFRERYKSAGVVIEAPSFKPLVVGVAVVIVDDYVLPEGCVKVKMSDGTVLTLDIRRSHL